MSKPTALDFVTCPFGKKGKWMAGYHTGIDYRAAVGTPIYATKGGRVMFAGYSKDYGNYIIIQSWHKGKYIQHLYAHLSHNEVRAGTKVYTGSRIGVSGNTGNSTGPHLHYEERVFPYQYRNHKKPVLPNWYPKVPWMKKKVLSKIK